MGAEGLSCQGSGTRCTVHDRSLQACFEAKTTALIKALKEVRQCHNCGPCYRLTSEALKAAGVG